MEFSDDAQGAGSPADGPAQHPTTPVPGPPEPDFSLTAPEPEPYHSPVTDAAGYGGGYGTPAVAPPPKPPGPPDPPDDEPEEDGMARMSFLEHLEELRKRLLYAIGGIGVAFFLCLLFSDQLWDIVRAPAESALRNLKVNPPNLKQISPMDTFQVMWMKIPILFAIFLSSPWILYQVWAFIAPGLYKKERRLAAPFILSSAGLFILGGVFAYFIAFRYGLEFLLGLGIGKGVDPAVSLTEYYDLFVDVMLGVGIVFEIPVLLFLLTLLHVANPAFLVRHSRYAILAIVALAAVITPTGDVFNLALFATPMIILFYVGIFASYLLVLRREKRRFPWATFFKWLVIVLLVLLVITWFTAKHFGYHFVFNWPIFVR
jgi:sec-independent protein translocase protein TatC